MVLRRSQLDNILKDELIDSLLQVENIEDKVVHLNKRFDDFLCKYNELHSEPSSDCNWTRTHNYLVPKRTLNHFVKLAK